MRTIEVEEEMKVRNARASYKERRYEVLLACLVFSTLFGKTRPTHT
jgi:hypothetical protein